MGTVHPQPLPVPAPPAERLYTSAEMREALRVQERCLRDTMLAYFQPETRAAEPAPVRHLSVVPSL